MRRSGRLAFACATSLVVLVTIVPSASSAQSATGPVAAYAFNEGSGTSATDASGGGLTGTLTNGAAWGTGRNAGAVLLDGVNDFVELGNPAALQLTGSMTVSAWVNSAAFPSDDAAIVSKRASGEVGYQLDTTVDRGPRTVGFKLTNSAGGNMFRYGATTLQANTWYFVTGVYDAATSALHVYLNGQLDDGTLVGTVTATQRNSTANANIGRRPTGTTFNTNGRIDDVRIYNRAQTPAEIQTDMNTPVAGGAGDSMAPTVAISAPANNAQVSGIVNVAANASDDIGVAGVQFLVDGVNAGVEDAAPPYALAWDTRTVSNGAHMLTARARDAAGNSTLSAPVPVNVTNASSFQNEILATGLNLPTSMLFLPDGRMLVAELPGAIKVLTPPYTSVGTTPFLQLTNVGNDGYAGLQQGIFSIALDPNFATNHYYYVFYTTRTPNRDRLSRFTANATLTTTNLNTEVVLYQDPQDANTEHHGGAIVFGNDGKLYFTTGDHFQGAPSQDLTSPRGKIHRINPDGTVPTDNPFYDGNGPNVDSIWALGLRNPYRAYYDAPTGRLFVGDVGGNDAATAKEEVNLGGRGANYGWPNSEGPCASPCNSPLYWYPHNGRDASVTGGFVYHGTQFPSGYQGSYFFADYAQNWIRRLTFDTSGNVNGVFNFEPIDGSVDGPYGDIVYLTEGPDGALYYIDLGYSDTSGTFGVSKIRRIRFVSGNQAPIAVGSANPAAGPSPLAVTFSSAGSSDPEGQTLTYAWTFGDGGTSTAANPSHTYAQPGLYSARLSVSDGANTTLSTPISISVGSPPTATILAPTDGALFRAGDVISFSGDATDPDDGTLPASAYTWTIDFLHEGHVHPGAAQTGAKSGTFTIPTSGHDFSGNTRYRIALTVTDSSGLTDTRSVLIYPRKVNLSFSTAPAGLTVYLDGIAKTTPFVYDTLIGFNHTVEALNQAAGGTSYTFGSWSDGGAQTHTIVVPAADQSYAATFQASAAPPAIAAYAFNEGSGTSATDASGGGLTGTLTNGAAWGTGRNAGAVLLDGVNDFVELGNPAALQLTGSMTVSAWVNSAAFPSDDAAIVSKRASGEVGYQLDTTVDRGPRTVGFKLTNSAGGNMFRYGATTLQANTWYFVTGVYDAATSALHVYLNGQLDDGTLVGTVTATQRNSTANANIGRRPTGTTFNTNGRIDDVRIYNRAQTPAEIQTDMNTPVAAGPGDPTPPTAPASLTATAVGPTQVSLSWSAATDNVAVTGYRVERCLGAGCTTFAEIAAPSGTGTTYNDTTVVANSTYRYRVRATDAAPNLGPYSPIATATTPTSADTTPPTAPASLTATAVGPTQVSLSWSAATDNVAVTGYRVERCLGAGCTTFAEIAAPSGTGTTYNDTTVVANSTYRYRVRATDAAPNLGPYSPIATATTPTSADTTPPTAPASLTATAVGPTQVSLSWSAATDNVAVTGYRVERCLGAGCTTFAEIAAPSGTGTTYNDTTVVANSTYRYRVRATDAAPNLGPYSPIATATTPTIPPTASLVAAYSFNEGTGTTVADASGTGNVGTIGTATWSTLGKNGSALSFNGTTARVTVPDSPTLRLTSAMTLEAWVFPTAVSSSWRDVIFKGDDNYYLMATSANVSRPVAGGIFSGSYGEAFGTSALPTNAWAHLAATYDGATLRLFVNGVQVGSKTQTGTLATSSNPLNVGGDTFYNQYFAGRVDDVRIYNRALTLAEIQTDMNTPVAAGA